MNFRIITLFLLMLYSMSFAQFNKLGVRLGGGLSNTSARDFNYLIQSFNLYRYPGNISKKLPSLSLLSGWETGISFVPDDDLFLLCTYRRRGAFMETKFTGNDHFQKYRFLSTMYEFTANWKVEESKQFMHFAGLGFVFGSLSAYYEYTTDAGRASASQMKKIASGGTFGISASYEVRYRVSEFAQVYLKPSWSLCAAANIRNLNAFLNPTFDSTGIRYLPREDDAYNTGNLNGISISAGIIFQLQD